jgi:hypothetical protein
MNFDRNDKGPCKLCGQCAVEESAPGSENEYGGRDPCLPGLIPGVSHACCGHGVIERAYVTLGGKPDQDIRTIEGGVVTLRGVKALIFFGLVAAAMRDGDPH